jgi:flagellar motor switch protein FliN
MNTYFDCWAVVAAALFSQALAGEPELAESLPKPLGSGSFGLAATVRGEVEGRFAVFVDGSILETPLMGEGMDQKVGWMELLREATDAAAGELLAKTGKKCQVAKYEEIADENQVSRAFQLRSGQRAWTILVRDEVRMAEPKHAPHTDQDLETSLDTSLDANPDAKSATKAAPQTEGHKVSGATTPALTPGLELLLDVELEAALRFGAREMPLGEILDLGPGDVVELDRHVTDPVDLIVGDKIVARGEVVLVKGNFGLRVTEVAAPRKRLESIRCLF